MKLELRGITKRFPGVIANQDVNLVVQPGEIHALLGENGAGKTTLMNVLYGLYHQDEGEILVDDKPVMFHDPGDAIAAGIGMVHQHFMLVPVFTVTENVMLGAESVRSVLGFLDRAAARARIVEVSERHGLAVDPDAMVEDLPVGVRQRVEILKALYRRSDVLILDEPTAVLTPQETRELFGIMRSLKEAGTSIIFITHKLGEVLELADRITVLRRGKAVETVPREGATEESLARLMVGREVLLSVAKQPAHPQEPVLEVRDLHVEDDRELEAVRGVSLDVRQGEIVGIAGVDGNGQAELVEAITGLRRPTSGTISVSGLDVTHAGARASLDSGVGHIPEDRHRRGLVLEFSLAENLALHDYRKPPASRLGILSPRQLVMHARGVLAEYDVRGGGAETLAGALSGGNQQKVVIARELSDDPKLLVAAQPTRGLDVGAIEFVHRRLVEERDRNRAILLISFELDEILGLSDRILVMFGGRIVGEYPPGVSELELGVAMAGGKRESAA